MKRITFKSIAGLIILAGFAAVADPSYREVDVTSALGPNPRLFAINDAGIVAAQLLADGQQASVLFDSHTGQIVFRFPDGDRVTALSNNGNAVGNDVTGTSWLSSGGERIVVPMAHPFGVNDAGTVVGFGGGFFVKAVVYSTADGTRTELGLGGSQSLAAAINSSGQVTGWATVSDNVSSHPFLWDNGEMIDLGTLGGTSASLGNAINNSGTVVGKAMTASGDLHAFQYDRKSGMQDLGTLPGCTRSEATAINDPGTVVGVSDFCASPTGARVFIVRKGEMADLNDVAPAVDGYVYVRAFGINNAGSIIGIALAPDFSRSRPFLVVRGGE